MNENMKQNRPDKTKPGSMNHVGLSISRQLGNIHSITLEDGSIRINRVPCCASDAIQESIEETFGK